MNRKGMEQFAFDVLNTSGVRDILIQKVPQIARLESLDSLSNLILAGMDIGEENVVFGALYEGVATDDLYPHVRANLIREGVISRGNASSSKCENQGQQDEYESVRFGTSGSSIQVILKAYNPNYQG